LNHPHIIPVYDFVRDGAVGALVMRLIKGQNADEIRRRSQRRCLDFDQVLPWFEQATGALAYAHSQGVVHRDIKPLNCLIKQDGNLVLADFGLSRLTAPDARLHTTGAGTFGFSAPEQLSGAPPDPSHDVYALGATFYALLAGQPPRMTSTALGLRLTRDLLPLGEMRQRTAGLLASSVPADFENMIHQCLSWNPTDRPTAANMNRRAPTLSRSPVISR
jgi:serine/threonine-protein kinase